MAKEKKGISRFAYIMVMLSVIAVLLGVGVFYWLMQFETTRSASAWSKPVVQIDQHLKMKTINSRTF